MHTVSALTGPEHPKSVPWQAPVLGTLQGCLMALRRQTWDDDRHGRGFKAVALKPLAPSIAWKMSSLLYRRLALCMAAHALKVSPKLSRTAASLGDSGCCNGVIACLSRGSHACALPALACATCTCHACIMHRMAVPSCAEGGLAGRQHCHYGIGMG